MSMSLLNPLRGAIWGEHNDRQLSEKMVDSLVSAFKGLVDNCKDTEAIPVVVRKSWISNLETMVESPNGMDIKSMPEMQFTEVGRAAIQPNNLWVLGGNHRRTAIIAYTEWVREEQKKTAEAQDGVKAKEKAATGEQLKSLLAEAVRLKKIEEEWEQKLEKARTWVVVLYDRGECHACYRGKADAKGIYVMG